MNNIDTKQLGYAFLGYLFFSIFMTLGIMPVIMHEVAAVSELLIAILSFYLAGANVFNHQLKRVVMPVGAPFGNKKK